MEKSNDHTIVIQREPLLTGDNIVSIINAIRDILISWADNYRQIRISECEYDRRITSRREEY